MADTILAVGITLGVVVFLIFGVALICYKKRGWKCCRSQSKRFRSDALRRQRIYENRQNQEPYYLSQNVSTFPKPATEQRFFEIQEARSKRDATQIQEQHYRPGSASGISRLKSERQDSTHSDWQDQNPPVINAHLLQKDVSIVPKLKAEQKNSEFHAADLKQDQIQGHYKKSVNVHHVQKK